VKKVFLLMAMLLACVPGFAEPDDLIRSFDELMRTLNEGGEVRLVIEYGDQLRENQNFGDNSVEINVQYLKPVTYKVIMDELFRTTIFYGTNKGAIRLYKD